jgi:hypothetical protein
MKYLVFGSGGPGFASPEEALRVLENIILPSFEHLIKLESEKRLIAGGLPVGERAFAFIIEAPSNDELDETLRNIPIWGSMEWKVTPLQTFKGRAEKERAVFEELRKYKWQS